MGADETLPWHYDARFHLITHDARDCAICDSWGNHFLPSAFRRDGSLCAAEAQQNHEICKDLCTDNSMLHDNIENLRADLARMNAELARAREDLADSNKVVFTLRQDYENLDRQSNDALDELRQRYSELEHQLSPRHCKMARRLSPRSSRSISPMADNREILPPCTPSAPARLLSRLAPPDLAAAVYMHNPSDTSVPSLTLPAAPDGLASRISDAASSTGYFISRMPLVEKLGFPALLPILYHENRELQVAGGSARLDPKGNLDFTFHDRFVLAIGNITAAGRPAWTTTLLYRAYFYTKPVQDAIALKLPIPLSNVIVGGENGVLISPDHDPNTKEKVDQLFASLASSRKRGRVAGYIDRIRYTPQELRGDIHNHALERWQALHTSWRQEGDKIKRPEPDPTADNGSWQRWLRTSRAQQGDFKYSGIPLIGRSYQTPHIEGMKAILCFLPHQRRGSINGRLREQFLHAAAALLSVPERYQETLTRLKMDIQPEHTLMPLYDETSFGAADHIDINTVASFLAHNGITTAEAEYWRAWATMYVEMELEKEPNGSYASLLKHAKGMAVNRISEDPKWILKTVSSIAPGNYHPKAHLDEHSDNHADVPAINEDGSYHTSRDESHPPTVHSDFVEEEARFTYGDENDEDLRMGPG